MADLLRAPLVLAFFALLSVAVTAVAAGMALERPSLTRLETETRSRLVADYSQDVLAMRLEPLKAEIIEAAASDETDLMADAEEDEPLEPLATATAAAIEPGSTATLVPTLGATASVTPGVTGTVPPTATLSATGTVLASSTPRPTSTKPAATSTVGPSPTATPRTPTPTITPRPTFTPTPQPTSMPKPSPTSTPTPPPTYTPTPLPTATPPPTTPTKTPTAGSTPILCELLPVPPPLCEE